MQNFWYFYDLINTYWKTDSFFQVFQKQIKLIENLNWVLVYDIDFYINNIIKPSILLLYLSFFFITCVVFMLILTIVIAAITLVERKTLALVQRRVGPSQTAFRGRFQYIADALKLLNKSIFIIRDSNRVLFVLWPSLALVTAYLFWVNAVWNPNLAVVQIEYNLLVMGVLSFFFL